MNARYKKEVRILWPMFGISLAMIGAASWLFDGSDAAGLVMVFFAGGCALIGAASFGVEFQSRTMLQLLAQPVSRQRLWFEKMLPLGTALLLAWLSGLLAVRLMITGEGKPVDFGEFAGATAMMAVCALFSAPAVTLFSRNFIGGVVFTIMLPFGLIGLFIGSFALFFYLCPEAKEGADHFFTSHAWAMDCLNYVAGRHENISLAVVCGIYCGALYGIGWRKFKRLEVADGQTQEIQIKLPETIRPAVGALANKLLPGHTGPIASLIRKELLLHRLVFFLAMVVLLILPVLAGAWKLHPSEVTAGVGWAILFAYLTITPVVIGAGIMAEERNWGTTLWQLTLPVRPSVQSGIKLGVGLACAIFLGVFLPAVLLDAGKIVFHLPIPGVFSNPLISGGDMSRVVLIYTCCLGVVSLASSLSTNSIRALTFAGGLAAAAGVIVGLESYGSNQLPNFHLGPDSFFRWNGHAILLSVFVVLVFVVWCLTFLNCQKADIDSNTRWKHAGLVILASVLLSTFVNIMSRAEF